MLFLALTFVGVAGIYIVLSADFVAVAQILIYAGAISVLDVRGDADADGRPKELRDRVPGAGVRAGGAGARRHRVRDLRHDWRLASRGEFTTTAASLGQAFLKPYVVPFEVASVLLMRRWSAQSC